MFIKKIFLFLVCAPVLLLSLEYAQVVPPALKKGDMIAIVAPASPSEEDRQAIAIIVKKILETGYRVRVASNLSRRHGYLAGLDDERAKIFMDLWKDPEVKALWCYRGGYGCARILDRLDYRFIRSHPKILIGMSDITALHAAIHKETGLVTFLGPNVNAVYGKEPSFYSEREFWAMISGKIRMGETLSLPKNSSKSSTSPATLSPGIARGRLVGGTLSIVVSLIGTPWEIETKGAILLLEEIQEEPFRIDRMLCQLKLAGKLDHVAGVILCSWKACQPKRPEASLSLEQVFRDYFRHATYPVLLGWPSGHIADQMTLPLNAMVELDASKKTIKLLQPPLE